MVLFSRKPPPPISCFYCLSTIKPSPRDEFSFECPHCLCWNRYDRSTKEILSDEPAMHEEDLNISSFAKRASPNKSQLPTMYGDSDNAAFCRSCQTNQTLIINLLSNYLPPEDDPAYPTLLSQLPSYTTSLHARYPPVCRNCQAVVDEKIRQKDHLARSNVLSARLNESKRRTRQMGRGRWWDVWLWRLRGVLWFISVIFAVCTDLLEVLGWSSWDQITSPFGLLLALLLSFFWTFWDPTWSSVRNAQKGGRDLRVGGREVYIKYQMIIWFVRLLSTMILCWRYLKWLPTMLEPHRIRFFFGFFLIVEIALGTMSYRSLNILQPVSIRLSRKSAAPSLQTTSPDPPLLSPLSLDAISSSAKAAPAVNPIFGLPSLLTSLPSQLGKDKADEEMDWAPSYSDSAMTRSRSDWTMRPQRFFPPEQPTGLEGLLAKTSLTSTDPDETKGVSRRLKKWADIIARNSRWRSMFLSGLAMTVAIFAIAYYIWDSRRMAEQRRRQMIEWERQRRDMIGIFERNRAQDSIW